MRGQGIRAHGTQQTVPASREQISTKHDVGIQTSPIDPRDPPNPLDGRNRQPQHAELKRDPSTGRQGGVRQLLAQCGARQPTLGPKELQPGLPHGLDVDQEPKGSRHCKRVADLAVAVQHIVMRAVPILPRNIRGLSQAIRSNTARHPARSGGYDGEIPAGLQSLVRARKSLNSWC